jgi:hypothetical protein
LISAQTHPFYLLNISIAISFIVETIKIERENGDAARNTRAAQSVLNAYYIQQYRLFKTV